MNTKPTLYLLLGATLLVAACGGGARSELESYRTEARLVAENLANFDDLDFNVFTHQRWDELNRSHSGDIIVHWPDGHVTRGLDVHVEDLAAMFVWAPDTRILEHPIRLGSGPWTGVMGYVEGTFTEPMPLPDGSVLPPTGRSFRIPMATIGHWTEAGVMDEEWLFWDNQAFMNQLGLGPDSSN